MGVLIVKGWTRCFAMSCILTCAAECEDYLQARGSHAKALRLLVVLSQHAWGKFAQALPNEVKQSWP